MTHLLQQFAWYFQHYGYWTIAGALLLENAGIPVPGETVLIAASVLAQTHHTLRLPEIILVGTISATIGDNLGYALGLWGGRPLIDRYSRIFRLPPGAVARGERVFERYGAVTVFLGRFLFGLRVLAGPMAGVLRMPWPRFVLFNALGAVTWVTVVASLGYALGRRVPTLLHTMRTANLVLLGLALLAVMVFWKKLLARIDSA